MEKTCSKCKEIKDISEFSRHKRTKGGYRGYCKKCHNSYYKEYFEDKSSMDKQVKRVDRRSKSCAWKFAEYKLQKGCYICGYKRTSKALHFHHLDKSKKKFNLVSACRGSKSYNEVDKEVKKCIILCSNCHAEVHAGLTKIEDIETLQDSPFTLENKDNSDATSADN